MTTCAGLVLAAGEGRRFGGPKAIAVFDEERLVDRAVRLLVAAGCAPVLVVLGAWVGEVPGASIVVNPNWPDGMGSSLRAGIAALESHADVSRALVTLVDLPGLTAAAIERVITCDTDLGAAAYQGVRGHPVLLARNHWAGAASTASGDRGARDYLDSQFVTLIEVGDVAQAGDLDER
ncbi:MAG: nucleotidyltransferase family protein [Actinomycetes bacterium]